MRIRILACAVCAAFVLTTSSFAALEQASGPGAQERTFLNRARPLTLDGQRAREG